MVKEAGNGIQREMTSSVDGVVKELNHIQIIYLIIILEEKLYHIQINY